MHKGVKINHKKISSAVFYYDEQKDCKRTLVITYLIRNPSRKS